MMITMPRGDAPLPSDTKPRRSTRALALLGCALLLTLLAAVTMASRRQGPLRSLARAAEGGRIYLPAVRNDPTPTPPPTAEPPPPPPTLEPGRELRAVWVSRYDWTSYGVSPQPGDIQNVVRQAATAGFNAIFFQVRAAGDAYYTPGLEPWSPRLTGTLGPSLGVHPGWDPLAELIERAHAAGIQAHAWLNVYPTWQAPPEGMGSLVPPIDGVWPPQALNRLTSHQSGGYGLGYSWRVYDSEGHMPITWGQYIWASPACPQVRDHIAAVAADIATRYPIDGLHLDNVRYPGRRYSLDPFTQQACAADPACHWPPSDAWRADYQRRQVTELVARITRQTHAIRPNALVSAAVWPVYQSRPGWPSTSQGYHDYYQDSHRWVQEGAVDAIAPMVYGSGIFTDVDTWGLIVADYLANSGGNWVLPGVGVETNDGHCVSAESIGGQIATARVLGAPGHAVFSLKGLERCGYLAYLRAGLYAEPALPPAH
jgi:uncharacterized lipoprotein YddW (UPF0748 family)